MRSGRALRGQGNAVRRQRAAGDQRRHQQHRGEADRRFHEREDQHQQAGQRDAGQLMGEKSARAAEPPQEGERHRQHHEVVSVKDRASPAWRRRRAPPP